MKIGIIGTAPQFLDAPFTDASWRIWAVPGCYGIEEEKAARNASLARVYEFHAPEVMAVTCEPRKGFIPFAQGLGPRFVVRQAMDRYPGATVFDYKKYVDRYGRAPFSCSVSWMLAEAIEEIEKAGGGEIGVWGVNMAHDSEYAYQKPGVRHMIGYAEGRGIKVFVPPTSELMSLHCLYGIEDHPPVFKILRGRTKDLADKLQHHQRQHELAAQTVNYMRGAVEEHKHFDADPEKREARRKSLEKTMEEGQKQYDDELAKIHVFKGALEEHQWVENNFFKASAG